MGKIWVKDFTGGLDARRLSSTTPPGVLLVGSDGHINSGAEFEKRAAFISAYALPSGTVGLAADASGLIVFGSDADPGVPAGVTHQQLVKASLTLVDVPSYDLYADKVYAVAEFDDGTIVHFYDATEVTDWYDGRARASFTVTGATGGTIDIKVNGVDITSAPVAWTTTNEATAAAIAADINSYSSSPEYTATSVGAKVNIIASTAGSASNGFAVTTVLATGFTVSPSSGIVLAGGADSAAFVPGEFVKTVDSKMYAVSGAVMHFSGIDQPTQWTTDVTGAGFQDVSKKTSGAEELLALANYQGFVAAFAGRTIVIFFVDPDPNLVSVRQTLKATGTVSPLSVTEFGDTDVFYLSLSGLRSLRARDSSNSASTTDLGVPVDTLIKVKLAAMSEDERKTIVGLINPVDGRFWLCFPDGEIFVFSFYSNSKISAWTTYNTGFTIDKAVVFGQRVYLRSDDTIYVYGGLDDGNGLQYDSTVAKAYLPFFNADKPTEKKNWRGIDVAASGTWAVYCAQKPSESTTRELVSTVTDVTFDDDRVPFEAECTHVSPQFESRGDGEAILSSVVLHYDDGEDE